MKRKTTTDCYNFDLKKIKITVTFRRKKFSKLLHRSLQQHSFLSDDRERLENNGGTPLRTIYRFLNYLPNPRVLEAGASGDSFSPGSWRGYPRPRMRFKGVTTPQLAAKRYSIATSLVGWFDTRNTLI